MSNDALAELENCLRISEIEWHVSIDSYLHTDMSDVRFEIVLRRWSEPLHNRFNRGQSVQLVVVEDSNEPCPQPVLMLVELFEDRIIIRRPLTDPQRRIVRPLLQVERVFVPQTPRTK